MLGYSPPALLCLWPLRLLVSIFLSGVVLLYISQGGYEELAKFNLNTVYSTSSLRVEMGGTL